TLIGNGQRKLVVIHQADFLNLRGIVDVIEKNWNAEHFGLLRRGYLNSGWTNLDGHFCIFVGELECIIKHFQVLLQSQGSTWQTLLFNVNVLAQLESTLHKDELSTALQRHQKTVVIFGVFANPGIAVVDVRGDDLLVSNLRQNDKPFLEKFSLASKGD